MANRTWTTDPRKAPAIGQRCEIPAYTDTWMRGARCGEVVAVSQPRHTLAPDTTLFRVRMDHPQIKRLQVVVADDCRMIGGAA